MTTCDEAQLPNVKKVTLFEVTGIESWLGV